MNSDVSEDTPDYAVKTVVTRSGERLPLLVDQRDGQPLFEPTVFAISELRGRGNASATIEQALRAVMVLLYSTHWLDVDLNQRMEQGRLLDLGEIEELVRQCHRTARAVRRGLGAKGAARHSNGRVVLLERDGVVSNTAAIRLHYVIHYLKWLTTSRRLRIGPKHPLYSGLTESAALALDALHARMPHGGESAERLGLDEAQRQQLRAAVQVDAEGNPWKREHARVRNNLAIRWLADLGLRRGELLSVRVRDINFQTNEVTIHRRADDPEDPRRHQPLTKTRGRLLPLGAELAKSTFTYISKHRRAQGKAKHHDFLFVADRSGAPLSLSALNDVFVTLRERRTDLPSNLHPHLLRHTWNDEFSELMDRQNVPPEQEQKIRTRLMGWSLRSRMPARYAQRHVRRQSRRALLELQERR